MKFILGQKQRMTQIFKDDEVVPVTIIKSGACRIVQVKTEEKDGYRAVQVGYGKKRKINKPLAGHLKKLGNFRFLREFRIEKNQSFQVGDELDISSFAPGDKVDVIGVSKGRGFQGVVKRHGFAGAPASHGTKDQLRMPGSIGATGPAHVFKGTRMAGQMGNERVTIKNLEIIEVDKENDLIKIKGGIPGAPNSLVMIVGKGEMKVKKEEKQELKEKASKEEIAKKEEKDQEENKEKADNKENKENKEEAEDEKEK